jgi:hypothetical protein
MATIIFNFNSSGHSEEFTIIAKFKNDKKIAVVAKKLKITAVKDKRVFIRLSSLESDAVPDIVDELQKHAPESVDVYNKYQELEIKVTLPKNANLDDLPLLLTAEQVEILKQLITRSGKPLEKRLGNKTIWQFKYSGEKIFFTAKELHSDHPLFEFETGLLAPGNEIKTKILTQF